MLLQFELIRNLYQYFNICTINADIIYFIVSLWIQVMLCNVKLQSGTKYSAKAKKVKFGKTEKLLEPATGGAVQKMYL